MDDSTGGSLELVLRSTTPRYFGTLRSGGMGKIVTSKRWYTISITLSLVWVSYETPSCLVSSLMTDRRVQIQMRLLGSLMHQPKMWPT